MGGGRIYREGRKQIKEKVRSSFEAKGDSFKPFVYEGDFIHWLDAGEEESQLSVAYYRKSLHTMKAVKTVTDTFAWYYAGMPYRLVYSYMKAKDGSGELTVIGVYMPRKYLIDEG